MGSAGKIIVGIFILSGMLLLQGAAEARVSGLCVDCHTMHNSQDNLSMQISTTPTSGVGAASTCVTCHNEPRATLLRMDCIGCHAQAPGGGQSIIDGIPQVMHQGADLAAGNYKYVGEVDAYGLGISKGHNAHGWGLGSGVSFAIVTDFFLGNTPPGYNSSYDPSSGKYQTSYATDQIMCAGRNGCHGSRNTVGQLDAMKGTHHADDSARKFSASFDITTAPTSVGNSYRFLSGVKGGEDSDWQQTTTTTNHNEYYGENFSERSGGSQTFATVDTISELCAECHGDFHASAKVQNAGSEWIRHPVDIVLPDTAPYTGYTVYSTQTPLGRQVLSGASASAGVTRSNTPTDGSADTVICLSCHRAHASLYPDALRWDYNTMETGTNTAGIVDTGCFRCHRAKDGTPFP